MNGLRRRSGRDQAAVENNIAMVLVDVISILRMDNGSLALDSFVASSGLVSVRIEGTCPDCAGSPAMFRAAIEAHVKHRVPEVREVRIAGEG